MSKPTVLILGSGPSAAYAFRACVDNGITPELMSATDPSRARGAFWLRWLPPSMADLKIPTWEIHISSVGEEASYIAKQWSSLPDLIPTFQKVGSSFPKSPVVHTVYDPDAAMEQLWEGIKSYAIQPCAPLSDNAIAWLAEAYDLVVQTFPTEASKKVMPQPGRVWVTTDKLSGPGNRMGNCMYNGSPLYATVRSTAAFGELNFEYGDEKSARVCLLHGEKLSWYPNLQPITQPCLKAPAANVLLVGRFARWDRKELSHHSYAHVDGRLKELLQV